MVRARAACGDSLLYLCRFEVMGIILWIAIVLRLAAGYRWHLRMGVIVRITFVPEPEYTS